MQEEAIQHTEAVPQERAAAQAMEVPTLPMEEATQLMEVAIRLMEVVVPAMLGAAHQTMATQDR